MGGVVMSPRMPSPDHDEKLTASHMSENEMLQLADSRDGRWRQRPQTGIRG